MTDPGGRSAAGRRGVREGSAHRDRSAGRPAGRAGRSGNPRHGAAAPARPTWSSGTWRRGSASRFAEGRSGWTSAGSTSFDCSRRCNRAAARERRRGPRRRGEGNRCGCCRWSSSASRTRTASAPALVCEASTCWGTGPRLGVAVRFGGETGVGATVDATTITPGDLGAAFRVQLLEATEHALRLRRARDVGRCALRPQLEPRSEDRRHRRRPGDRHRVVRRVALGGRHATSSRRSACSSPSTRWTRPPIRAAGTWAEVEVDRLFGDAQSWTFILDGRRFQRLARAMASGCSRWRRFRPARSASGCPTTCSSAWAAATAFAAGALGSRRGRNQFIGTLEYSFVAQPVTIVLGEGPQFLCGAADRRRSRDLGFASDGDGDQTGNPAIDGYGVGLRFLVPFVDVIRLDVAWGEPGQGATAYFGVSLKAARQRQRVR